MKIPEAMYIVATVFLLLAGTVANAQQIGEGGELIDPSELDPGSGSGAEPNPNPDLYTRFDTFQLVGFTSELFAADQGILNLNRGCQRYFPESRMCTDQEIFATVNIPEPSSIRDAWVHRIVVDEPENSTISRRPPRPSGETVASNCHGWTSSSLTVMGAIVDMGHTSGCYGGVMETRCSEPHAIACCSQSVPVGTR